MVDGKHLEAATSSGENEWFIPHELLPEQLDLGKCKVARKHIVTFKRHRSQEMRTAVRARIDSSTDADIAKLALSSLQ